MGSRGLVRPRRNTHSHKERSNPSKHFDLQYVVFFKNCALADCGSRALFYGRTEKNPRSLPPADLPAIAARNDGAPVFKTIFALDLPRYFTETPYRHSPPSVQFGDRICAVNQTVLIQAFFFSIYLSKKSGFP